MAVHDAYLAGFFDGEGCVSILRAERAHLFRNAGQRGGSHLQYTVLLALSQTDPAPLIAFQERFGGKVRLTRHGGTSERRKPIYIWKPTSQPELVATLEGLLPYLIVKREQAEIALRFRRLMGTRPRRSSRPITAAEHRQRQDLYEAMQRVLHGTSPWGAPR